ncbi:WecB/TagA/CpsF family glycosyltransferase [Paraflavitalea speifideaquila]|uniref:WecB/TagA/CpsF family glycosyltransferase n=1 Tax=Paraflavitalea speifideaquila TaxID=3076558 RepID=UPI0028E7799E|nr:WecB/TagA/CpsF family glycosyltransferase [Paraflavitalea speifideiaquila]
MDRRFDFLGVSISATNLAETVGRINAYNFNRPGYICFPDASVVKEANEDPLLISILNNSYLTMPDGKPSQIVARLKGYKNVSTVSGFHLCHALLQTGLTHYFYGGNDATIASMKKNLEQQFPQAKILGYKAPPFVSAVEIGNSEQVKADIEHIRTLQPNLVWIGISSPKQDYLMHHFYQYLPQSIMLGVGGVFLYFADESLRSPEWVKRWD